MLWEKIFGRKDKESKKKSKIDLTQQVFFGERYLQESYDREIDEGCSSGLNRYATIDITSVPKSQAIGLLEQIVEEAKDFSVCKLTQVGGFNKDGKRYITVSGESHYVVSGTARDMLVNKIREYTNGLPVVYVQEHITLPIEGKPYEPVDLGPYGSTGAPMHGVAMHPGAAELRKKGKIR